MDEMQGNRMPEHAACLQVGEDTRGSSMYLPRWALGFWDAEYACQISLGNLIGEKWEIWRRGLLPEDIAGTYRRGTTPRSTYMEQTNDCVYLLQLSRLRC